MKRDKVRTLIFPFMICIAVCSALSCAPKTRVAVNQLDTPERHTFTGLKLLDQEKYADAQREFKMAIQLNNNYSRAYTGMAMVDIFTNKFNTALDDLTLGSKYANSDEEKLFVNVARIQYYTISKSDPQWPALAKKQFDEAVAIDAKHASAYYFMGLAYKDALEFNLASQMFTKVIQLKTDHVADADAQLKFLQKVQLAMPSTETGKRVALTEKLTRADTAALFMEELKIKNIYNKAAPKAADLPLKETAKGSAEVKENERVPAEEKDTKKDSTEVKGNGNVLTDAKETQNVLAGTSLSPQPAPVKVLAKDIADQPYKTYIEGILEAGVRGLENDPNGNFNPGEVISRGEYAIMLEDVMLKLTGENGSAAKHVNAKSLFPDVPSDMPCYDAVMAVTSRGIMEARNTKTGEFAPLKPLSGVEALMIIRKFKEKLKIID
ncbi:MAG TPA: S-layer homology domain-containing protein [Smithella sp.]|nr:S-layer homology domain-containing protein [Smithella sp.]